MAAVLAQNFPASWVAPEALEVLPQKVQSLLQRLGPLEGPPVISRGPSGLQAIARFQNASDARAAVQTLHGFDMRSAAEKASSSGQAPKPSECFCLRIADESGAPGAVASGNSGPKAAPRKRKLKPNGIFLWPLPEGWAAKDVELLTSPYGPVQRSKVETMANGQRGVLVDFMKESAASAALTGLNGLSLMGLQLRCVMQEEPEPSKPLQLFKLFLDELPITSVPKDVEPKLDDREIFVTDLPRKASTEDGVRFLLGNFGEVEEVLLVRDQQHTPIGKAYVRFKSHSEAVKALDAIRSSSSDGASKATWSESERALRGTRGAYGLNVLRHICGEGGAKLREIRQAAGAANLSLETVGEGRSSNGRSHVHLVASCEEASQAEECWKLIATALAHVHETYSSEVRGSLVLRGFPASWSEKGLKFVFAPFGGLSSVTIEEEEKDAPPISVSGEVASSGRLAYVKLRNSQAMEKAVANLHQTKVGDGDLVEECVVACHRWHQHSWSDGTFQLGIFVDQLALSRRPQEVGPGPDDRELYVRNLPLHDMTRQQLQEYFEGFGEVDDLHLILDPFTGESTNEGYIRFKHNRDAQRCIEALTPSDPEEADPTDLQGSWSESERVLQRKNNCYRFNLVAELVGADGSGLEKMKEEAKLKGLWILGESLQLKDRTAPRAAGRQLHFVGRCAEEPHARVFRDIMEREIEAIHKKILSRLEKRKQKESGASAPTGTDGSKGEDAAAANGQVGAWQQQPSFWGNPIPPAGYEGYQAYNTAAPRREEPAPGAAWAEPPVSVFEQEAAAPAAGDDRADQGEEKERSRGRHRRKRSSAGEGGEGREKRRRSGSRRRRRRAEDGAE
eukprot:TRINITY_DN103484_c0_g1_i1.p1 TRINITY_DN103484_c0_g1~~TRINITY_DN103484_c0_g1_i1.p1  ORF type:complete len:849 (+),score=177.61 TRINITY_DN103484_c0_g1_i1:40-2586(+)